MDQMRFKIDVLGKQDAEHLAARWYGLTARARELPGELNQNFLLETEDRGSFILKAAHPSESIQILNLQRRVMEFLNRQAKGSVCSEVIPTHDGEEIISHRGRDGNNYHIRLVTFLPGTVLARFRPHSDDLLLRIGRFMGRLDSLLSKYPRPAEQRFLEWDLRHTGFMRQFLKWVPSGGKRRLVRCWLDAYESEVVPVDKKLRMSVIHNDGNDHNLLIQDSWPGGPQVSGILDFGDMVFSHRINELAILSAYLLMSKSDPLSVAYFLVKGYNEQLQLSDLELRLLQTLIAARLSISVIISAIRKRKDPANSYITIHEQQAWELLDSLSHIDKHFFYYTMRDACGREPCPQAASCRGWLKKNRVLARAPLETLLPVGETEDLDLSITSSLITDPAILSDPVRFSDAVRNYLKARMIDVGVAGHLQPRLFESSRIFSGSAAGSGAVIHLGVDFFSGAGTAVFAVFDGIVHDTSSPSSCDPAVCVLEHPMDTPGTVFYTLYGGLDPASTGELNPGLRIKRGQRLGCLAESEKNSDKAPHLHFQLVCDPLHAGSDFPHRCRSGRESVWASISPDPGLLWPFARQKRPPDGNASQNIAEKRRQTIGPSLSLSYRNPLHIVRGIGQYLFDDRGRRYLDAVNNVPHVGHCHPHILRAVREQMAVLNTNTRYLHGNIVRYAERLLKTLPAPLRVCFFVNSGSEANELALRLARTHTGTKETLVVDHAYHGNTGGCIEISPYKFNGPGGAGAADHVHTVMIPDTYRGPYRGANRQSGRSYADDIKKTLAKLAGKGGRPAAFIHESLPGVAGQIMMPPGYLSHAYNYIREAGGVCIADEVQVGFGRIGSHFWAFESQGVVPDILTLGKPMGNGHPLGAVITTPEIASSFNNGMEYFNTFGGNPVSCAVGLAVLDVIERQELQRNARLVGEYLLAGLQVLKAQPVVGDVRGKGLFIGIELVLDRHSLEPAPDQASYIVERLKNKGVLISTDGPLHNVLKIKPPLIFSRRDADTLIRELADVLEDDFIKSSTH